MGMLAGAGSGRSLDIPGKHNKAAAFYIQKKRRWPLSAPPPRRHTPPPFAFFIFYFFSEQCHVLPGPAGSQRPSSALTFGTSETRSEGGRGRGKGRGSRRVSEVSTRRPCRRCGEERAQHSWKGTKQTNKQTKGASERASRCIKRVVSHKSHKRTDLHPPPRPTCDSDFITVVLLAHEHTIAFIAIFCTNISEKQLSTAPGIRESQWKELIVNTPAHTNVIQTIGFI